MTKRKVGFYGGKFAPFHNGHLYALTKAASMVEKLYVIVCYVEDRDKKLFNTGKIPYVDPQVRLQWITTATKTLPNVTVLAVEDVNTEDMEFNWIEGARRFKEAIPEPIDTVFSSEYEYEDWFNRCYEGAEHIVIDPERSLYPISATQIRNDGPFKHWDMIPDVAKPFYSKKVAIIGTESCGKTTLAKLLANLYQTVYVEEYGRTLSEELGRGDSILTEEHYKEIVYGNKFYEYRAFRNVNKIMFVDTEAIVTQYYAKLYNGVEYDFVENVIENQNYDLYIYLEPDIAWVDDGMRTFGEQSLREKNSKILKEMLRQRDIPFVIVRGNHEQRLEESMQLINKELLHI